MPVVGWIFALLLGAAAVFLAVQLWQKHVALRAYQPLAVEQERVRRMEVGLRAEYASHEAKLRSDAAAWETQVRGEVASEAERLKGQKAQLADQIATAHKNEEQRQAVIANDQERFQQLREDLGVLEGLSELQSFGFYEPQFEYEDSERFKAEIKKTKVEAKLLIRDARAWHQPTGFAFNGSVAQGKKYMKAKAKLMLRAFNGEADAAIATVKHGNVASLEKRLTKTLDGINKAGEQEGLFITRAYFALKLKELHLTHERQVKIQEEREEQRRIKEQMREEARAETEIEKAKKAAEVEEARQEKALERAREELAESTGKQHEKLEGLVERLENELKQALDKKAKAIARAQLTKSGHVYVISNLGSFGDGIYKIGMTRRFEPLDRVKELGDASVPFLFDVHAMIFSENAPALERALHHSFDTKRVNRVNRRKEFFHVSLEEIRREVGRHHGVVTFVTVPPAEDYRRTQAIEDHDSVETLSA